MHTFRKVFSHLKGAERRKEPPNFTTSHSKFVLKHILQFSHFSLSATIYATIDLIISILLCIVHCHFKFYDSKIKQSRCILVLNDMITL